MKQQAWVKPFIIILSVITAISIVCGASIHMFSFISVGDKVSETVSIDKNISALDVDLSVGNIRIKYGDQASVSYEYPKRMVPDIKCDKGVLKVLGQKNPAKLDRGMLRSNYKVIVVLPKDKVLDSAIIKVDMGNVEFETLNVTGRVNVDLDMGNAEFGSLECGDLMVDLDMGNFEIEKLNCNTVDAKLDMGNIEMKEVSCESVEAKSDMGNIEVYGSYAYITADCSMGNLEVKSDNPDTVFDVNTDMGNCSVNGVSHKKKK